MIRAWFDQQHRWLPAYIASVVLLEFVVSSTL